MSDADEIAMTAIKIEKRLCGALMRQWSPSGMSVETLANEAADEIERLRRSSLTAEDRNRIRQWYNALDDVNPNFLEASDQALALKIMSVKG